MAKVFYLDDKSLDVELVSNKFGKLNIARKSGQEDLGVTSHKFNGEDINHLIKIISSKYDAVILEYNLGDAKTGVEIARELRDADYKKPIIIFSASKDCYSSEKNSNIEDLDLRFADKIEGFESLYWVVQAAISKHNEKKSITTFAQNVIN